MVKKTKLSGFTIENDSTVHLQFNDGHSRTVAVGDLSKYLDRSDLTKVNRAVNLRRYYIKTNLPPWLLAVVVSTVALIMLATNQRVANWYFHKSSATVAEPSPPSRSNSMRVAAITNTPAKPSTLVVPPPEDKAVPKTEKSDTPKNPDPKAVSRKYRPKSDDHSNYDSKG